MSRYRIAVDGGEISLTPLANPRSLAWTAAMNIAPSMGSSAEPDRNLCDGQLLSNNARRLLEMMARRAASD